ncbi:MAG: pyridoxal phosphate-dependent aminotransferase [Bacteroidales bacterium]|nr:pyridoxal phosphate-dependent aminotransferase [Bacteroidales bacterium]
MINYQKPTGSWISYFSTLAKKYGGINLAQGIPGFNPPPLLRQILSDIAFENVHQYPPGKGNFKLVEQLIKKYLRKGFSFTEQNILILQGATEAINLVFFLFMKWFRNDAWSVATIDPPYEAYVKLPEKYGKQVFLLPIENRKVNLEFLKNCIRKNKVRLFFLASPGNPWGVVLDEKNVRDIVKICEKEECHVFFDAVYEDVYLDKPPYVPYDLLNPFLWIASSFSKKFSITGWRIGYLVHDSTWDDEISSLHDYIGLCASGPMQEALARFLHTEDAREYENWLIKELRKNYRLVVKELEKCGFSFETTDGGYFLWGKVPQAFNDGWDFATQLFDKFKVALVPGEYFSKKAKSYVRINFARPHSELEEGLWKIQLLLQQIS